MKTTNTFLSAALLGLLFAGNPALSQESKPAPATQDEVRALREKINELERQLEALEGRLAAGPSTNVGHAPDPSGPPVDRPPESPRPAAAIQARDLPRVSVGEKGFSLSSADTNFVVQLKGVLQVDSRSFFGDTGTVGNDSLLLRRARPMLQGTVFRDFDFMFVPDFGGSGAPQIYDAYLNYRYSPGLQLQAGKFKTPVGFEVLQADRDLFFNERALPSDLAPNRDLGFMLHGDLFGETVSYAAGVFNGVGDAQNSSNVSVQDDKSFAGRLFIQPFKTSSLAALEGLGFGLGASYQSLQATNTADLPAKNGFATVGQQAFFAYSPTNRAVVADGVHWRLSPQVWYASGPFDVLGEYIISDQGVSLAGSGPRVSAPLNNTAWQIAAGWVITGEKAAFDGILPRRPFDPRRGRWGAWQVLARYSELDLDPAAFEHFSDSATSARSAREWSVGLNWYLNGNVRLLTSFSHTDFEGGGGTRPGTPGAVTRKPENVLFTRLQLAF